MSSYSEDHSSVNDDGIDDTANEDVAALGEAEAISKGIRRDTSGFSAASSV